MAVDAHVRARLIEDHLPLVRSIAGRYARGAEPLEDLVQVGSVGLIKAVDRFEPERGNSLAALARPAIEGEIRHHLRDRTPVARGAGTRVGADALDQIAAAVTGAPPEDRAALATAWSALEPREQRILDLRFREDLSQAEIGRRVRCSQAQVSRLQAGALDKLRAAMGGVAPARRATYSEAAMDEGQDATQQRSGRFLVRMPQSLHEALAREAEHEGVSLNTLITNALAGAVSWRDGDGSTDPPPADAPPRRATNRVLVLNLIVVGVVAIAAVILLVLAITQS